MDLHILRAEQRRIADDFRSTLTSLGILRAQLIGCTTDEARQHLLAAIEEGAGASRDLSDELLRLDVSIMKEQARELRSDSPLFRAPLDF